MRLEGLTIALRPRSPWEAADLGIALVRQHAARIYGTWVLVTLPVCLLLTKLGMLLGHVWIGMLLLWWLKPLFDRIPLFVLSRAVFGATPSARETLVAQRNWGWRAWRWMHWRRLHPGRALLMPVDLLEGLSGRQRSERCNVLSRATGSPSLMITVIGVHAETMLYFSIILVGLMFVPIDFLPDKAKAVWETLVEAPPVWAQALNNLLYWLAMSIMEPFYVGAGFGLYLNRRTQLEAWDIELAFRRLAARLRQSSALLVLLAATLLATAASPQAQAQAGGRNDAAGAPLIALADDRSDDDADADAPIDLDELIESAEEVDAGLDLDSAPSTRVDGLETVFSKQYRPGSADFEAAVRKAYAGDELNPKTTVYQWEPRVPPKPGAESGMPAWAKSFAQMIAFLAENGLWILVGLLVIVLIRYLDRWLPWISDRIERERALDAIDLHDIAAPYQLPDDLAGTVRSLWQSGQRRAALALFYRAAVQRLIDTLGTPLPPGATESECLRQSRRLEDRTYAGLFARIVRSWQGIAYAERVPTETEFNTLLDDWLAAPVTAADASAEPAR